MEISLWMIGQPVLSSILIMNPSSMQMNCQPPHQSSVMLWVRPTTILDMVDAECEKQ